jgi:hypothetical protein
MGRIVFHFGTRVSSMPAASKRYLRFAVSLRDAYGLATDGRAQTLGPRSPWASASSPFSAEPAFSAAASFDISASTNSPFGSHQGIRSAVADCSDPMIRNFSQ